MPTQKVCVFIVWPENCLSTWTPSGKHHRDSAWQCFPSSVQKDQSLFNELDDNAEEDGWHVTLQV
ncbi:hypothetical protein OH492_13655 [Vibrio chagasii]|nr:hypothetical protein [Vibrio chagasii]